MISGPKKVKFRKQRKGKIHGRATSGNSVSFGEFGLRALEPARMTAKQIESARKCISREMNKAGKFWNCLFPHYSVSVKPADTRMGGGKGSLDRYVVRVKPGHIIFEIAGISEEIAKKAFSAASYKLPFETRFIKQEFGVCYE